MAPLSTANAMLARWKAVYYNHLGRGCSHEEAHQMAAAAAVLTAQEELPALRGGAGCSRSRRAAPLLRRQSSAGVRKLWSAR